MIYDDKLARYNKVISFLLVAKDVFSLYLTFPLLRMKCFLEKPKQCCKGLEMKTLNKIGPTKDCSLNVRFKIPAKKKEQLRTNQKVKSN